MLDDELVQRRPREQLHHEAGRLVLGRGQIVVELQHVRVTQPGENTRFSGEALGHASPRSASPGKSTFSATVRP